ncbi:hypothetical protein SASPL_155168 [Salvia splendens]|uniref:Uncharacterized protein n=1 Tax=Salvia splendens TaxID=180675 RepID=A0A8X8W1N5_SALSN|nr:hypothetical protein SASPL_155168 [Salvia splendens]
MASWVRTITSPFRKACTFFNQPRDKKSQQGTTAFVSFFLFFIIPLFGSCPISPAFCSRPTRPRGITRISEFNQRRQEKCIMDLQGEVMACAYEDVQVMWSILDKNKPTTCTLTS